MAYSKQVPEADDTTTNYKCLYYARYKHPHLLDYYPNHVYDFFFLRDFWYETLAL